MINAIVTIVMILTAVHVYESKKIPKGSLIAFWISWGILVFQELMNVIDLIQRS